MQCKLNIFIALGIKEILNLLLFSLRDLNLRPEGEEQIPLRVGGPSWLRASASSTKHVHHIDLLKKAAT